MVDAWRVLFREHRRAGAYGFSFAFFTIGNTLGALIGALSFDHLHSYTPAFLLFAGALVVACALFLTLGTYTA